MEVIPITHPVRSTRIQLRTGPWTDVRGLTMKQRRLAEENGNRSRGKFFIIVSFSDNITAFL